MTAAGIPFAFPEPIQRLPQAKIPLSGVTAFLSQASDHQVVFMQFEQDITLPEHSHGAQAGFVLAGRIDLIIAGKAYTFTRGDSYQIPAGTPHSGTIHAGYADISFFEEADRYKMR